VSARLGVAYRINAGQCADPAIAGRPYCGAGVNPGPCVAIFPFRFTASCGVDIGITTFAGAYGMEPHALGRAVDERGFESLL
jgi:hypothetical protein